jgi:tetratricopeptide (TPR) repeat protein
MAEEKWQKVREIFDAALHRQPEERRRFVLEACGDDKILLAEVESLLSSLDSAESFESVAQLKRVIAMDASFSTTYSFFWQALEMQGNYDEAFEWRMKSMALPSPLNQGKADEETVQSYRAAYQTSGWQGVLREDVKRFDAGKDYYFFGAVTNAQVGNKDKAFEYLEKSYQRHELWIAYLQVYPHFDSLRDDPRFNELVKRVGLML